MQPGEEESLGLGEKAILSRKSKIDFTVGPDRGRFSSEVCFSLLFGRSTQRSTIVPRLGSSAARRSDRLLFLVSLWTVGLEIVFYALTGKLESQKEDASSTGPIFYFCFVYATSSSGLRASPSSGRKRGDRWPFVVAAAACCLSLASPPSPACHL